MVNSRVRSSPRPRPGLVAETSSGNWYQGLRQLLVRAQLGGERREDLLVGHGEARAGAPLAVGEPEHLLAHDLPAAAAGARSRAGVHVGAAVLPCAPIWFISCRMMSMTLVRTPEGPAAAASRCPAISGRMYPARSSSRLARRTRVRRGSSRRVGMCICDQCMGGGPLRVVTSGRQRQAPGWRVNRFTEAPSRRPGPKQV